MNEGHELIISDIFKLQLENDLLKEDDLNNLIVAVHPLDPMIIILRRLIYKKNSLARLRNKVFSPLGMKFLWVMTKVKSP